MASSRKATSPVPERADELTALLHELSRHDDASELRQFVELCRASPRVRAWLFGRFAMEPKTQEKFRAFLRDPVKAPDGLWSAVLQREVASKPPPVPSNDGPFGGLSESAVWALIKHYQAGRINVMTFMLVRVWRQLAAAKRPPPSAVWRATLEHWAAIVGDGDGRLLRDLTQAVAFFNDRPIGVDVNGDAESWKTHVLLHILDNPQPAYRVGELFDSLLEKFRRVRRNGNRFVERREIRKFCEKHSIRRDQRGGRRPLSKR